MANLLMNDRKIAEILRISDRRVRQLAEENRLVAVEPGRYCVTFAIHSRAGEKLLQDMRVNRQDKFVTAACSWLLGHVDNVITNTELNIWFKRSKTWGLSKDDALAVLANAQRLLGKQAPKWRVSDATD